MNRISLFICLLLGFANGAIADQTVKLDLDQVRATGVAQAVDGVSSAGQPDAEALQVFADSGYATVIDLRGESESRGLDDEASLVEELGMSYVALPVSGSAAVNFENASRLDELIKASEGPVLVHCGSGNRVGALLALRASAAGADDAEALKIGKDAGLTSLESVVKDVLNEE